MSTFTTFILMSCVFVTCIIYPCKATREYYLSEKKGILKYSEVRDFVFTKDCLLHLGIAEDKGNDWMLLQLKTMVIPDVLIVLNTVLCMYKSNVFIILCIVLAVNAVYTLHMKSTVVCTQVYLHLV